MAAIESEPEFVANPSEVSQVLLTPLHELLSANLSEGHTIQRRELAFRAPHLLLCGHQVWGATSMVLAEFRATVEALNS